MASPEDTSPPPPASPPIIKWPNRKEDYELLEVIGSGATSVVQTANCIPLKRKVAIKRIDLERCGSSIEELQKEISLMSSCNHPNVINYYTSFVVKDELWLVMRLMSGGSLLDIVKHVVAKGTKGGVLDEVVIATVLREVLQGLDYFHSNGQIHRDIKAGNILVGEDGSVQLADFGVSNWLYDSEYVRPGPGGKSHARKKPRNTFVGTPCWMAPEVMDQSVGYNEKADIWSFGITALELATGTAPYAKFPPMKVLMLTLENPPPTLETCGDLSGDDYRKNYSKSFQKLVEKCLQRDPEKRPSASELLKHPFIKKAKNKEFLKDVVLGDAPSLTSRAKKVRRVPGTSGRLHKSEDGGWVWSDDELTEEYEPEEGGNSKLVVKTVDESRAQPKTEPPTTTSTPPSSTPSQPVAVAASVPGIQVQPPPPTLPDTTSLQFQRQQILQQLQQVEQQLVVARQQQQQLQQLQQNPAQFTEEQHLQAMKVLENVQLLERQKQMMIFQHQQIELSLQQAQATQAMEKQMKEALKLQQKQAPPQPETKAKGIKLALRKRTEQNNLKDIKFDYVPGQDSADRIANDLVSAGLVDGKNLVLVAANIRKIVENPTLDKLVFQLVRSSCVQPYFSP